MEKEKIRMSNSIHETEKKLDAIYASRPSKTDEVGLDVPDATFDSGKHSIPLIQFCILTKKHSKVRLPTRQTVMRQFFIAPLFLVFTDCAKTCCIYCAHKLTRFVSRFCVRITQYRIVYFGAKK